MPKYRSFCFTYNNYPVEYNDDDSLDTWLHGFGCLYIVAGREISPTTETPHLQGYCRFKNPRSLTSIRALFPGCHIEPAKGTPLQCRTYCTKDSNFRELGPAPIDSGALEKKRWDDALHSAKEGDFDSIPADIYIRYIGNLERIRRLTLPPLESLPVTCGYWIQGPTGSGKSRGVREKFPLVYPKPMNKWWDSYIDQEEVLIDDVDYNQANWIGNFLKIWADHYPFIAEFKGGSRLIRPKKIIVTTQYSIENLFNDSELQAALNRRFRLIKKAEGEPLGF
ncbi:MAG: putative viral replication protein [Cressdnaviricota sp.]|nr:MAG: putative viral replication protein [Cressdnaviricota sp.]